MLRRVFLPILAASLVSAAVLGGANRASAAIRVTISDGTTDKVFYSTSSQTALFATDLGAFDLVLETTLTNFPGQTSGGTLSQSINLSDLSSEGTMLPTFTFTADVIEDVAGVSSGEVTGAQRTQVEGSALARFTLPSDAFLRVSSDVAASVTSGQLPAGTVQHNTTVNGVTVSSLPMPINSMTEAEQSGSVANTPSGYTLSSEVVLSGANSGMSNLVLGASSGVTALTPEPGSMLFWALGGLGLVVAATNRRRFAVS
jgi:hypothetical protein